MPTTTLLQAKSLVPTMTVNDLDASLRFYRDGLGFAVKEEHKEEGKLLGVMLEAGSAVIGIAQDDFTKGRDRVKGIGSRIYINTDQDIEALAKQAKSAGVTKMEGPAPLPWGPMAFTVTDPDGFKLTISKPM